MLSTTYLARVVEIVLHPDLFPLWIHSRNGIPKEKQYPLGFDVQESKIEKCWRLKLDVTVNTIDPSLVGTMCSTITLNIKIKDASETI